MAVGNETTRTMKRRGILAAAGAVVAGIVAKQAAAPVLAATNAPLLIGKSNAPTSTNDATNVVNPLVNGVFPLANALVYVANFGTFYPGPPADSRIALAAYTSDLNAGGVGDTTATLISVLGRTNRGFGLYGLSSTGIGCWGESDGAGGVGIYGLANGAGGTALFGYAPGGNGVYGVTNTAGYYGVLGTAGPTANATAIAGQATGAGASAFSGGNSNPNGFAAYFDGHVQVNGPFDVIGAGNKHAAVAHPDGSHRTIYSIEAPEAWVEDFGTGTLAGGKADIKLDADFAALIHTDAYHVFLTEYDQHNALHVTNRTAGGFVVQADAATATAKGKSVASVVGAFSWRVVARPKTTAKVGRLAKVNIADATALLPDPAKLPKQQQPLDFPPPTPGRK